MRHRSEDRNNQRGMDRSMDRSRRQPNYGNQERFSDMNQSERGEINENSRDAEMYSRGQAGRYQSREDDYGSRREFGSRENFSREYSPGQFGEQSYTDFDRGYGEDRAWESRPSAGLKMGRNYGDERGSSPRSATGSHVGKGPKGYSRSDERIREDVCEALSRHGEIDASEIEVEVENGEVTLTGSVNDRRIKRLAEECVEELSGVRDVTNSIRVSKNESTSGQFQPKEGEHTKRSEGFKGKAA